MNKQPIPFREKKVLCLECGRETSKRMGTQTHALYKCEQGHISSFPKPPQRRLARWSSGPNNAA